MRNLKKFLALVLAMMMVMGLMMTANAATSFSDDADVKDAYREAVEVLTAIEVIQGKNASGQGAVLAPNDIITRAEFATILYRVYTGDVSPKMDNAALWSEQVEFDDVPSTHWAADVIGYCQFWNLLEGTDKVGPNGLKLYEPDKEVDGSSVLTGLLRALGYDGKAYGPLTGDDWAKNALKAATAYGLVKNLEKGVALPAGAPRQLVAQMAFNALTYVPGENGKAGQPEVKYSLDTVVRHFGSTTEAESYAEQNGMNKDEDNMPRIEIHTTYPNSLLFNNFDELHLAEGGEDDFGRPVTSWNNSKEVALVESLNIPDAYYLNVYGQAATQFNGKVAKALSKDGTDLTIMYNGEKLEDATANDINVPVWQADTAGKNNADSTGIWGNDTRGIAGYEIFVYGKKVVLREAFLAVVGATNSSTKAITLEIYGVNSQTVTLTVDQSDKVYEDLSAFEEGDYIAVYPKPGWAVAADPSDVELLEVDALEKKPGIISEVYNSKAHGKWESTIELKVNNQYPVYGVARDALILPRTATGAKDFATTTVVDRVDKLGKAILYLYNGSILLIDQRPEATDPVAANAGFAYFYDVIEIPSKAGDTSNKWDSEGGTKTSGGSSTSFMGRLLMADESTLGGYEDGVPIRLKNIADVSKPFESYEAELGKLVMYVYDEDDEVYDIYPIAGVNLGNITRVSNGSGDTQVKFTATANTAAYKDATTGELALKITKNKSEAIMPSDTLLDNLHGTGIKNDANVAFDLATAIYVIKTGINDAKQPDFDFEYHVYDITTLPQDININRGLVTIVGDIADPTNPNPSATNGDLVPLDGELDASTGDLKVARAVLIVDSGVKETSEETYFIVKDKDAPLVGLYKDKPGEGGEFWFYEFDAVVNGKYQKVLVKKEIVGSMFGTNIGVDNYWLGTKVTLDTYVNGKGETKTVITKVDNAEPLNKDTLVLAQSVTEYKNGRIGVDGTAGDLNYYQPTKMPGSTYKPSSESYLVQTDGKAFTYDLTAGTIKEISIEDFNKKNVGPGGKYATVSGIAIRNESHTILTALFIDVTPAP